jgi:hypothetical protein
VSTLDAHLKGDRHKRVVEAVEASASGPNPVRPGKIGRPTWQASVGNATRDGKKQKNIGDFFLHLDQVVLHQVLLQKVQ